MLSKAGQCEPVVYCTRVLIHLLALSLRPNIFFNRLSVFNFLIWKCRDYWTNVILTCTVSWSINYLLSNHQFVASRSLFTCTLVRLSYLSAYWCSRTQTRHAYTQFPPTSWCLQTAMPRSLTREELLELNKQPDQRPAGYSVAFVPAVIEGKQTWVPGTSQDSTLHSNKIWGIFSNQHVAPEARPRLPTAFTQTGVAEAGWWARMMRKLRSLVKEVVIIVGMGGSSRETN